MIASRSAGRSALRAASYRSSPFAADASSSGDGPRRGGCRGARTERPRGHLPDLVANVVGNGLSQICLQSAGMPGFERLQARQRADDGVLHQVLGIRESARPPGNRPVAHRFSGGRERSTSRPTASSSPCLNRSSSSIVLVSAGGFGFEPSSPKVINRVLMCLVVPP